MVGHATDAERCRSVVGLVHQQQAIVLHQLPGRWEVPIADLRQGREVAANNRIVYRGAFHQDRSRVLVLEGVSELPDQSDGIGDSEGRVARREAAHIRKFGDLAPVARRREAALVGLVAPRERAAVCALRRQLPLVRMRQALAGPPAIATSFLQAYPNDGLFEVRRFRMRRVLPMFHEVEAVSGLIAGLSQVCREGLISDREAVHVERADVQLRIMKPLRRRLPWKLDVNPSLVRSAERAHREASRIVGRANDACLATIAGVCSILRRVAAALNLHAASLKVEARPGHEHRSRWSMLLSGGALHGLHNLWKRFPGAIERAQRFRTDAPHRGQQLLQTRRLVPSLRQ
mmetsp:Transcript_114798/g.331761  ORF Transcript_114798/g.331761 Transcript_114798/m.331761 type:complete len:346 (+) Transcript_114798:202-1239(+)